ncbi:MAG: hypothetical protein KDE08_13045 [Rhodobacteraceae bacterium]|nr:hypothetical protein [Paracoccaceae bacterium]
MLELDSPRWQSLTHAYGTAKDTPELLRQLAQTTRPSEGSESEPWNSLWSSLCHQGDAYDASYAAAPHIVEIACNSTGPLDFSFFMLPASIEIARCSGKGPLIPTDLETAYKESSQRLLACIARRISEPWDFSTLISAMSAQAAAKGFPKVAEVMSNLDEALVIRLIDLDFDI